MVFITEQDVFDYLGIDYADDMTSRRVKALIDTIDAYLTGAIGENYAAIIGPNGLAKAREIGLMLIGELYDSRGATDKERSVIRSLLSSMMLQLQLDYEESRETEEADFENLRQTNSHSI